MHEFSIVQSLMDAIEAHAAREEAESVSRVVLRVGPLAGVVPHLLKTAFDTFKARSVAEAAELVIETSPLELTCRDCRQISTTDTVRFKCPQCSSLNVEAREGDALVLERLEMEVTDGPT